MKGAMPCNATQHLYSDSIISSQRPSSRADDVAEIHQLSCSAMYIIHTLIIFAIVSSSCCFHENFSLWHILLESACSVDSISMFRGKPLRFLKHQMRQKSISNRKKCSSCAQRSANDVVYRKSIAPVCRSASVLIQKPQSISLTMQMTVYTQSLPLTYIGG